jgi:hypothetical protein
LKLGKNSNSSAIEFFQHLEETALQLILVTAVKHLERKKITGRIKQDISCNPSNSHHISHVEITPL